MNSFASDTLEIRYFRSRLGMMCDYWRSVDPDGTGGYWRTAEDQIRRQVEIENGDVMSYRWSTARGFGGGGEFFPRTIRAKLTRPVGLMQGVLRRLPNPGGLLNPFWRLHYFLSRFLNEGMAFRHQTRLLLEYGEALFGDELERYGVSSPEIMGDERIKLKSGRWMSYATLRNFNILRIVAAGKNYPAILEIGAGLGELARIFLSTQTTGHYIIVDVPPALAFSERFLEKSLGADAIDYFDPGRSKLDTTKKVHFLMPNQMDLAMRCELCVNIASFGEMTRSIVEKYVVLLKKSGFDEFFSINQRIGKTGNSEAIGEHAYAKWFGPEYAIDERGSFRTDGPVIAVIPDQPGQPGYQLLRFRKRL